MKLTFLGTAAAVPSIRRNVSALALQFDQRREWWLFDCGEGTQQQLLKTDLSLAALSRIFISHLHGDHCFGLVGLLATRGMMGGVSPVHLYGPPGLADYVAAVQRTTGTRFGFPVEQHVYTADGLLDEDDEYKIFAARVMHAGITLAFVVEEKDRQGRFKIEEAQALGIPPGPLYSRLKNGETITLDDGRVIEGSTLVDLPRQGRKVALVFDAGETAGILPFAMGSDLAVHESTYATADAELAKENAHSTAADAGRFGRAIGAKRLILSHFSPRYDQRPEDGICIADLVKEADAEFAPGQVMAAKDFFQCEIKRK